MKQLKVLFLYFFICLFMSSCNNLTIIERQQWEVSISFLLCGLFYLIILIIYLHFYSKAKIDNKKIAKTEIVNAIFLILTMIMTLIIYAVFLLLYKEKSNVNYLIGIYFIFAICILLINVIIKRNDDGKLLKPIIFKFVMLIILQYLLNVLTNKIIELINLNNDIAAAVCSTSLIGLAIYTFYIFIKNISKLSIEWCDATLKTYILTYYLITMSLYLIYDKDNVIGCILVLISIIMALFQNNDSIVDYLVLPIKTVNSTKGDEKK